jgi:DNA-directed RNA polymerase subunit RPC12/RpoP
MALTNYDSTTDFLKGVSEGIDSYVDDAQDAASSYVVCPHCAVKLFLEENTTALTADILSLSKENIRPFIAELMDFRVRMEAMSFVAQSILELASQVLEDEVKEELEAGAEA